MSVLSDVVGAWLTRESLREATFWAPVLGFLAGDAAFAVGDMAEEGAKRAGVPESLIETHEHQTGATLGIFEHCRPGVFFSGTVQDLGPG